MMNFDGEFKQLVFRLIPYIITKSALTYPAETSLYIATQFDESKLAAKTLVDTVYKLLLAYVENKCEQSDFITEISSEELIEVGLEFLKQLVQGKEGDNLSAE